MKTTTTLILVLACALGPFARQATTSQAGTEVNVAGVRGVILAFDNARGGFVMFNPRVGRLAVKVDGDSTRVAINQRPADLGDLQVGMHAIVSGPVSPTTLRMRARSVRVRQ